MGVSKRNNVHPLSSQWRTGRVVGGVHTEQGPLQPRKGGRGGLLLSKASPPLHLSALLPTATLSVPKTHYSGFFFFYANLDDAATGVNAVGGGFSLSSQR